MMDDRGRVYREVPGPKPYVVALVSRRRGSGGVGRAKQLVLKAVPPRAAFPGHKASSRLLSRWGKPPTELAAPDTRFPLGSPKSSRSRRDVELAQIIITVTITAIIIY